MSAVPIILLTGFLGSGKTTFINWILHQFSAKKISVIVNEFGSVKLESQFIQNKSGDVMELANGCMCCAAKSDIPRIISLILDHSPKTEYILIEASGLSDPDPIKETLLSARLAPLVYLHTTLCIIDSVNFEDTFQTHPLILSQAADSDVLLLSKASLATEEEIQSVLGTLKTNMPTTPVYIWDDELDLDAILTHKRTEVHPHDTHHIHEKYYESWFESEIPIPRTQLNDFFKTLPKSVYRAKGVLHESEHETTGVSYVAGEVGYIPVQTPHQTTRILFLSQTPLSDDFFSSLRK